MGTRTGPGKRRSRQPAFDYSLDFDATDFREHPELYRIGKGEQGVLLVEPYKSELLPLWRFRTPEIARESAEHLYDRFERYRAAGDFVGMDMARKFLQMGFTRARRYANHKSGRKWSPDRSEVLPPDVDPIKAESARIFYAYYRKAAEDPRYIEFRAAHLAAYPNEDDP
ncbi:MAG: FIG074102: hypothetical protein [uncultured Thermomicrobiales bacterium]|uniref:DUF4385 domain-containing protein n=1 Tax=uncultured Thermomicrobiales bacterium TaxID=1645740 RepID=A0A6J4UH30_9BACT|nr:MAG: FIG074102: hypothetical protein [uncultured Thermomicrobiales bacterium]